MIKTVEGLRRSLRKTMPVGAVKQNPENERSAVNPMFVVERLNDCFGESGWTALYQVKEAHPNSKMIVVECELRCWHPWVEMRPEKADIVRRAFGGNDNLDRGDAYKGACTDALTKAASHLGIAHQVYKGLYDLKPQAVAESEPVKRDGRTLNQAQQRNFWSVVRECDRSQVQVDKYLSDLGVSAVGDILKTDYEVVLERIRRNQMRIA